MLLSSSVCQVGQRQLVQAVLHPDINYPSINRPRSSSAVARPPSLGYTNQCLVSTNVHVSEMPQQMVAT